MDTSISDLMIHVDEMLPPQELLKLEDDLRHDVCVISACVSPEDRHLVMVTFNPECTTAANILHRAMQRGLHAELIGL